MDSTDGAGPSSHSFNEENVWLREESAHESAFAANSGKSDNIGSDHVGQGTEPSVATVDEPLAPLPILLPLEPQLLAQLEEDAKKVSANIDYMLESLKINLHAVTGLSLGCENAYGLSVEGASSVVDDANKSLASLIVHARELDSLMGPIEKMAHQVQSLKKTLD
eukprot:Opistho-2@16135